MSITVLLYVLALVCFLLAAFGAKPVKPAISFRDLAFAFLTLSLILR